MFLWFSKVERENQRLQSKVEQLEQDLQRVQNNFEQQSKEMASLRQQIAVTTRNATPSIDFDGIRAFSIERMTQDNVPVTIIGYYKTDWSVGEWRIECNDEHHEKLVKEFNTFKSRGLKNRPVI